MPTGGHEMSLFGKSPENKPADSAAPAPQSAKPNVPPPPVTQAPSAGPRPSAAPGPTPSGQACVIGAKTTLKGEITGDEDILVEGRVEGQIRITRDLRIGPTGSVKATIDAQSVVVSGEVVGDCSASIRVEIQASGKLTGNIRAPKIVIAEGAMFKGNSDMSARKDKIAASS
jgi:cytoskeletal protein CcmA (bactofilin family)